MRVSFILLVAVVGLIHCDCKKIQKTPRRYDRDVVHIDSDYHYKELGFSAGSGLRSIAQGSANNAHISVAKQNAAVQQAVYIAKSTLAQQATQAAATAHAALAAKEILLHGFEEEVTNAHHALEAEIKHYQLAKNFADAAKEATEAAEKHFALLSSALSNANTAIEHSKATEEQAGAELVSQVSMVDKAKSRLSAAISRLQKAQVEFEGTKEAVNKASAAAHEAHENASNAADVATHALLANAGELHLSSTENSLKA